MNVLLFIYAHRTGANNARCDTKYYVSCEWMDIYGLSVIKAMTRSGWNVKEFSETSSSLGDVSGRNVGSRSGYFTCQPPQTAKKSPDLSKIISQGVNVCFVLCYVTSNRVGDRFAYL